ncbi:ABC transporter substrate-binding protein [Arthrobacter sp. NPDC058097]|uniref:ABC transporter substrate-binding protein n=1 Tax=Arthrobacter sp. NPDC058097 TaxID=3346340 RepID=UPI0036DC344C
MHLTFWSWLPAGLDKSVDLWNKEHPNVQVKLETVPAGSSGTYAKMRTALQAGSGAPDLAQIEYQNLPEFVMDDSLIDLAPLGMADQADKFIDWQVAQSTFDSRIVAVPQASGPMGLYYRKDVFAKLGIKPPTTWQEYADAAAKVHAANPKQYLSTFPPGNSAWFTALAWQSGAKWFGLDGDTWTVNIDTPETRKVAQYWDDLIKSGAIKTEPDFADGWYSDLQNGNIVGWASAQWGEAILKGNAAGTSGKWSVAPMPQWGGGKFASSNWGGSTTAVLKTTKNAKEAADFALWLNSDPRSIAYLYDGGFGWPAAKDGLSNKSLSAPSKFLGGQETKQIWADSDKAVNNEWKWIPTTATTYQHLNDAFQAAVEGHGTFVDAVAKAQQQTLDDLKAKGLNVRAGS